jgi:hypothetical protein
MVEVVGRAKMRDFQWKIVVLSVKPQVFAFKRQGFERQTSGRGRHRFVDLGVGAAVMWRPAL